MSVADDERLARVALNSIAEPGDLRMATYARELGPLVLLDRLQHEAEFGDLRADLAARLRASLAAARPEEDLARGERLGLRFVVPGDDEWPRGLADLAQIAPLHERGGEPLGLWLKGPLRLHAVARAAVAVVGSRSATSYGADVAAGIAADLGRARHAVVSGAAFGIDQAAHRGALAVDGATVAVLACGADLVYPEAHRALLDYVAEVGLVVSEAPIGGAPTKIRFLARNRLIAALTGGTVVVEAAIRSGALNTASWAGALGRTLMGVPGPVTSAPSAGVHQLIRSRDALLVTSGAEVLEAVSRSGLHLLPEPRAEPTARDLLEPVERQVLDAVPVARAAPLERIARAAGVRIGRVREALDLLSRRGLVEHAGERWRLAREPRPAEGEPFVQ